MKTLGFPRELRLHLQKDFEDVFGGKRVQLNGIILWWKPVSHEHAKMGIVVSKKLGSAVERNRAKRLIREVFRLNRTKLKSAAALVISPRTGECFKNFETAEKAILELWQKAGLIDSLK